MNFRSPHPPKRSNNQPIIFSDAESFGLFNKRIADQDGKLNEIPSPLPATEAIAYRVGLFDVGVFSALQNQEKPRPESRLHHIGG